MKLAGHTHMELGLPPRGWSQQRLFREWETHCVTNFKARCKGKTKTIKESEYNYTLFGLGKTIFT